MKILVACEESQTVCLAFRNKGHEAYSCDIIDCSGGHPEWHIKDDVIPLLNGHCSFTTIDGTVHNIEDKWDLIIAHPPCFVAGTKIMTYDGIKNIEDIKIGDLVLTHTGEYKKVYNTMQHQASNLVDVHVENSGHIKCTDNHPFYTQTAIKTRTRKPSGVFKWIAPKDFITVRNASGNIKQKTLVSSICDNIYEEYQWNGVEKKLNQFSTKIEQNLPVNNESFWYIIGRWLGDGTIYRKKENGEKKLRGITICCNKNETEELQKRIDLAGFISHPTSKETTDLFYIYGKEIASFCLQFGEHADGKFIPGFITRLPEQLAKKFLEGYFDADGCLVNNNKISFSSVSSNLAYGIKYLINKYLKRPCSITHNDNSNRNVILGRTCNVKDSYSGSFTITKTNQEHTLFYENYILSPYRKITPIEGKHTVYNLSVEDNESYTANGIIVHNCTFLTTTGNRWFNVEKYGEKAIQRIADREEAYNFFMTIANADCDKIAIENPVGYMNTHWRKPDQIIQPWMFGDPFEKRTCIWLKGLPQLTATNVVEPPARKEFESGKTMPAWYADAWKLSKEERSKLRSKTFPGFANAMAEQWG